MILMAQADTPGMGWLSSKLLGVTLPGAEWMLWVLVVLSALSLLIMLERALFLVRPRLNDSTGS
jgi:biopolymer transport protein ExbB